MKKLVEIWCDGNSRVGFGHIKRSAVLAEYLHKNGFSVRYHGLSYEANKLLPITMSDSGNADAIVIDTPNSDAGVVGSIRSPKTRTIALDYFGLDEADLTLSIFEHYKKPFTKSRKSGIQYIIVRNDLELLSKNKANLMSTPPKVTVVLGGADILGLSDEIAGDLHERNQNVTQICGPVSSSKRNCKSTMWRKLRNPDDFPTILANSDWLVTNGGSCLFESIFLEKPAWVVPQTEQEVSIASLMLKYNAVLGIGNQPMVASRNKMEQVSASTKNLIDNLGKQRIMNHISEIVND